ncbi:hypothetical protein HYV58_00270 [Candidatus Peregrinibacteria bacterium]|nr:hypothetical protein [Candidatus Peregrinibacteria bacterium]
MLGLVPEIDEAEARKALAGYDDLTLRVPKEWRSAIARLVYAGTMVGAVSEQSKKWQPFDPLTRAALAVVLEKFLALP